MEKIFKRDFKYREIPYNYTSFSDKEIIVKYFDAHTWDLVEALREKRRTGRSAKLLFENIGDIFIIDRNPYIQFDIIENPAKLKNLQKRHQRRLATVKEGANGDGQVLELIDKIEKLDDTAFKKLKECKKQQEKILNKLKHITSEKNIQFSPFHRAAHVTDATDWRVEYPFVVVYPDTVEEVQELVKAAKKLGLVIIARGGGTGLTGGAIPLLPNTMIINTEKFNRIGRIEKTFLHGNEVPVITVDAGAVTEDVIEYCEHQNYIFATDPTSAWACTIGGNIAENAGGKKCVMWGTCIDNVLSFDIVDHNGELITVKRVKHLYRKILPDDVVEFEVIKKNKVVKTIILSGLDIRKKGLGKDITNKALGGLPGLQKEGCDGIIVSATFVLYKPFKFTRTVCFEFFGNNMINASKAIVEIVKTFEDDPVVFLTALEHFDEQYVKAIQYKNKSLRTEIPKAVLVVDIESDDEARLEKATLDLVAKVKQYNTEGIIAKDTETRNKFWQDRKNLSAIARHTNAFKLNEDVVIPLERLQDFSDFIEKLNIQKELENNIQVIAVLADYLQERIKTEDDKLCLERCQSGVAQLKTMQSRYMDILNNIDTHAKDYFKYDSEYALRMDSVFQLLQNDELSINFDADVIEPLSKLFYGYDDILNKIYQLQADTQKRRIIVATHMHAGDGNVHVNIPVHSNDYLMMKDAEETAANVMQATVAFGGVVSGEHGIGLTKIRFIDDDTLAKFAEYNRLADPEDLFNPLKLTRDFNLETIYTPSFNLLEGEAFILKATDLETVFNSIATCIRCGKCKSVCNTHYPDGMVFYNPRNKILATALVMEAVIYDIQTSTSLSFKHFKNLREISNYCTICHNCQKPCPVAIDFGTITLKIRSILEARRKSTFKPVTSFTLFYLKQKGYYINKLFRVLLLRWAYSLQRFGYYIARPIPHVVQFISPYIAMMLKGRLPKSGDRTLRDLLQLKNINTFYVFTNKNKPVIKTVVYFPGCGSERMFPDISIATIALLYYAGVRVIIPPTYLCCGYPMRANGKLNQARIKTNENRVLFHRMADTFSYLDIGDIVVSCGTCYEMLLDYQLENVFRGARLIDVNEFIAREGLYSKTINDTLIYHEPCHTPLKAMGYQKTFSLLLNTKPVSVPNCCGEGGTLALSTPDISNSLRERKETNIRANVVRKNVTVLTTCPSCVQGLCKIQDTIKVTGKSLVVYIAEQCLGKEWKEQFLKEIKTQGFDRYIY